MARGVYILVLLLFVPIPSTGHEREPPLSFPSKRGIDLEAETRCERLLDEKIPLDPCFINVAIGDLIGWFTNVAPGVGVSYSTSIEAKEAVLPATPGTLTLCMTNTTYREALNDLCYAAHLSWRLEQKAYESGAWIWIRVDRPERFIEEAKNKNWFDEWLPLLFLLAIGGMYLLPVLFKSLIKITLKEEVLEQVLGRRYCHILNPSFRKFVVGEGAGYIIGKIIHFPFGLFAIGRLKYLMEKDRKKAIRIIFEMLRAKGNEIPKDAWREFYRRNPEASKLRCPVDLKTNREDQTNKSSTIS